MHKKSQATQADHLTNYGPANVDDAKSLRVISAVQGTMPSDGALPRGGSRPPIGRSLSAMQGDQMGVSGPGRGQVSRNLGLTIPMWKKIRLHSALGLALFLCSFLYTIS